MQISTSLVINTNTKIFIGSINLLTLKRKDLIANSLMVNYVHQKYYDFMAFNNNFYRRYSSLPQVGERKINSTLGNVLNTLFTNHISQKYSCNEESQMAIERLVFDQYELLFKNYKGYTVGGIDLELMSPKLKRYILSKEKDIIFTI